MKARIALLLLALGTPAWADQFFGGGGSSSTPLPTSTPAPTATPAATVTPVPTSTPAPTATPQSITVKDIWGAGSTANITNATTYLGIMGAGQALDTAGNNYTLLPLTTGTMKRLVCRTWGSPLTTTQTWTITVEGATAGATGLTCQITSASVCNTLNSSSLSAGRCCEDTSHTYSVTTGDAWTYKWVPANTPNLGPVTCGLEFDPS